MVPFSVKGVSFTAVFFFLIVSVFGQTTSSSTANSTSLPATAQGTARTVNVSTDVIETIPLSGVETMFGRFQPGLAQFGYAALAGPAPAPLPRGRTPEPYTLGPGDQLTVLLWGDPVDLGELASQFNAKIDGDGTFFYPPVGQVRADGLLRTDAEKSLVAGLARKYKRFDLKLLVTSQRVFPVTVAGLVSRPGTVMVDSWTSLPEILAQTGGVEKNGTLRNIKVVKVDGREIGLDLYDLLIRGRKPQIKLEEGDVLWVGPIGKTVALSGQVKVPGIFELKSDETLGDLLSYGGGLLASAHGLPVSKVTKTGDSWVKSTIAWRTEEFRSVVPLDGDLFSFEETPTVKDSSEKFGFVKIGGEVRNPGFIEWVPGLTIAQALEKAGGIQDSGNASGLVLTRAELVTFQRQQLAAAQQNNEALVTSLQAKLAVTTDTATKGALGQELAARIEAGNLLTQSLNGDNLGRIQLDNLGSDSAPLKPGDSIFVPKDNGVILVLGEVYNPGAQVWRKNFTVGAALDAVGGISVNGSADEVYLIRATGRVESVRAKGNFLGLSAVWGLSLQSGDVIYAPTKRTDSSQFWASTKEVISVLAQTTSTLSNVFVILKTLGLL